VVSVSLSAWYLARMQKKKKKIVFGRQVLKRANDRGTQKKECNWVDKDRRERRKRGNRGIL
jgi:hypothetical protein